MFARLGFCGFVLLVCLAAPATAQARRLPLFTHGDEVEHLGDLPPELAQQLQDTLQLPSAPAVGYKYSHFGVFWLPIWTWGGEYCLYVKKSSNEFLYEPLKREQAAGLLRVEPDSLSPPGAYRFPKGLFLLLGLVVLGIGYAQYQKRKVVQVVQRVEALLSDPQYEQAVKLFGTRFEERLQEKLKQHAPETEAPEAVLTEETRERLTEEAALEAKHEAIDYLTQRGVPPQEARKNLEQIIDVLAALQESEESA